MEQLAKASANAGCLTEVLKLKGQPRMLMRMTLVAFLAPACAFLAPARPLATPRQFALSPARLPPLRCARGVRLMTDDEDLGGAFRQLGIMEDATYDEITDSFMELSETYAGDDARLATLEAAKEKVLDARLRQRMAGAKAQYAGGVAVEDRPPPPRIPVFTQVYEQLKPLFLFPNLRHSMQVTGLIGGLTVACWVSPNLVSTALLLNIASAMGYIYNRGEEDPVRDDFGQIGEIKPMKPKPFLLTCAIAGGCFLSGWWKTRQMTLAGTAPGWMPMPVLRVTLVSAQLIVCALFLKVQTVFDDVYERR